MTLYHYPSLGLYLYASTKQILDRALKRVGFLSGACVEVPITSGDILKLASDGSSEWSRFDDSNVSYDLYSSRWQTLSPFQESSYIEELKAVAGMYGFSPKAIDRLLMEGFMPEEIEEYLYESCCIPV